MKKRYVLAAIVFVLLGYIYVEYWPAVIHYRLTLTVDKNGEKIEGSSVVRAIYDREIDILPSHAEWHASTKGEATMVDLGDRGILFALLKEGQDDRSGPDYIALKAFGFMDGPVTYPVDRRLLWIRSLNDRKGERINIPLDNLPMLVRFRDINDPKSVERVDPHNLAASFGSGVTFVSATIEITDDPVTVGIKKTLGWLNGYYDTHFDGERYETIEAKNRFANSLAAGLFSTERPNDNKP